MATHFYSLSQTMVGSRLTAVLNARTCLVAALVGAALSGCQTVPITGRHQLILISQEEELSLGEKAYAKTLKESALSHDQAAIDLVERVGRRIAAAADRPDYKWEFTLVENKTPNAFALPGGKVVVYTGILPITRDETGLAVVLGHEVAHALAHHGAERMSTGLITEIGAVGVAAVLGGNPETAKAVEAAFGIGVMLPFSRAHESEADHIGIHLMAKAGYDPRQAVDFWKRMEAASKGGKPTEFLSTHPSDEHRVEQIEAWMPEVLPIYKQQATRAP
ncbi:MAG TPA: M48 family metallopeptidase [Nitrospiria bacterium]|nr:M48 family metallopeptidase [Nitrospiria bacterium]